MTDIIGIMNNSLNWDITMITKNPWHGVLWANTLRLITSPTSTKLVPYLHQS